MDKKLKPLALGVDLGGSKILTAVVNTRGEVLSRDYQATPADEDVEASVQAILKSAGSALKQADLSLAKLSAISIGVAGISNPETGVVFASPHLPKWHNVPLRDIIERESGKKTFLINDAKAAALGELYFGAGRGAQNFIYVTLGTGIGGGIIINRELYRGAIGTAGEIGHMTIDDEGPRCACGNKGCWEALASGSALAREAKLQIQKGTPTSILDYTGGDMSKVTAQVIQAAAEHGDTLAKELIARTGHYLGVGLANLINIFNPELIVIGGGLANMGDMLLGPAFKVAGDRAFKETYRVVRFVLAELGENAGVIGAATFAFNEMKRTSGSILDEE